MQIMLRRGSFKDHPFFTPGANEPVVNQDNGVIVFGDGETPVSQLAVSGYIPVRMWKPYEINSPRIAISTEGCTDSGSPSPDKKS